MLSKLCIIGATYVGILVVSYIIIEVVATHTVDTESLTVEKLQSQERRIQDLSMAVAEQQTELESMHRSLARISIKLTVPKPRPKYKVIAQGVK